MICQRASFLPFVKTMDIYTKRSLKVNTIGSMLLFGQIQKKGTFIEAYPTEHSSSIHVYSWLYSGLRILVKKGKNNHQISLFFYAFHHSDLLGLFICNNVDIYKTKTTEIFSVAICSRSQSYNDRPIMDARLKVKFSVHYAHDTLLTGLILIGYHQ